MEKIGIFCSASDSIDKMYFEIACKVSRNDFAALSSWVHCQRNRKDVGTVVAGRNQIGSTGQKQIEKTM